MKAFNVLPSEERVKDLHFVQWIWLYLNILEDEQEKWEVNSSLMDYLAGYINPKAVRRIRAEKEAQKKFSPEVRQSSEELFNKILEDATSDESEDLKGDNKSK